jgi:uncharacterized protein YceH (UPF0502 family)
MDFKSAGIIFGAVFVALAGIFGILSLSRDNTRDIVGAEVRPVGARVEAVEKHFTNLDARLDRMEGKLDKLSEQVGALANVVARQAGARDGRP